MLRNIKFILVLVIFLPYTHFVQAEDLWLTDDIVPWVYESRAKIPSPEDKLASLLSMDYQDAQDEFARRDLFRKIKPVLAQKLELGREASIVLLRVNVEIGEYDFEKQAFPTGFTGSTFIPFENGYAVMITNVKDTRFLDIPENKARTFASSLRDSRYGRMNLRGKITGVGEQRMDIFHNKAINIEVLEYTLEHEDGTEFGTNILK